VLSAEKLGLNESTATLLFEAAPQRQLAGLLPQHGEGQELPRSLRLRC